MQALTNPSTMTLPALNAPKENIMFLTITVPIIPLLSNPSVLCVQVLPPQMQAARMWRLVSAMPGFCATLARVCRPVHSVVQINFVRMKTHKQLVQVIPTAQLAARVRRAAPAMRVTKGRQ